MKKLKKIARLVTIMLLTFAMLLTPTTSVFAAVDLANEDGVDACELADDMTVINNITDIDDSSNSASGVYTLSSSQIFKTVNIPAELYDMRYSVPDEILAGTTDELLQYFLESRYLCEVIHGEGLFSSFGLYENFIESVDFSVHKAFNELISREDFMAALENYAKDALTTSNSDEEVEFKLEIILRQDSVASKLSELSNASAIYPNLNTFYVALENEALAAGNLVGSLNNINYYSAGTVSTINGNSVEVCVPERELTESEINDFNEDLNYVGNTLLANPTSFYNCHSYAWYDYSYTNPYWINNIIPYVQDSACTDVTFETPQVKDIIVYVDANGVVLHSGIVHSISDSGDLTIRSKWGQGGVYEHSIYNVPAEYTANGGQQINYCLFRYHDYKNVYRGTHYHSNKQHYYLYAYVCQICGHQTDENWLIVACSGLSCAIPWSLRATVMKY